MKSKFKLGDTFKQGELTYMVTGFDAQGRAISVLCPEEDTTEETGEKLDQAVETVEETTTGLHASEEKEETVEKTVIRKRR